MYRPNKLKAALAAGRKVLGCWLALPSPPVAEIVGHAGYDFVILDHEHGSASPADAVAMLQALAPFETTVLMRVPWNDPVYIKRALDTGVEGIMIPMVETAEQARAAVAACRYPPDGIRGSAYTQIRASNYGRDGADYLATINRNLVILVQIETALSVDNIAEIAGVDGVDVLFVGPNDLAGSIGELGRSGEPPASDLIARACTAIRGSGKILGTVPRPGHDWQRLFTEGCQMVAGASDIALLREGSSAQVKKHTELNN